MCQCSGSGGLEATMEGREQKRVRLWEKLEAEKKKSAELEREVTRLRHELEIARSS